MLERPVNIPHTFIRCTRFENPTLDEFLLKAEKDPEIDTYIMDMSHFMMMTHPQKTAKLLLEIK